MWFVDIVCDITWFSDPAGKPGDPLLRQALPCGDLPPRATLLIYGSDHVLRHARILLDVPDGETADQYVGRNLQFWLRLIEVSTLLVGTTGLVPYSNPGSTEFMIVQGEGDEHSPLLKIVPNYADQRGLDIKTLQACLANWKRDSEGHLFYLARLMNDSLPLDVRWLHGYRLAEWHYQRGAGDLAKNSDWRALLEQHRGELQPLLKQNQTLHGLMERIRATAAHAIAEPPPTDERTRAPVELVKASFSVMYRIALQIANDPEVSSGTAKLEVNA